MTKYNVGQKFTLNTDLSLRYGEVAKGTYAEIIEIDNSDFDVPYKVWFDSYKHDEDNEMGYDVDEDGNWSWITEEEIEKYLEVI